MPRVIGHLEIKPSGVFADGEEFPYYVSDDGIAVEYDHGINFVTVRLICDSVSIPENPRVIAAGEGS